MSCPPSEIQQLKDEIAKLQHLPGEVTQLRKDIQDLLDAWKTTVGVVKAVKWLGKFSAAVGAIYALFKLGQMK